MKVYFVFGIRYCVDIKRYNFCFLVFYKVGGEIDKYLKIFEYKVDCDKC